MALTKVNTDLLEDGGKLDGIEALADVTDTANVTAAGALMDSELTSEASVKALNQGVATTDSPTFAGLNATGDLTLDVAGDIILDADGADVILKDGGTGFLEIDKDGDNARLKNPIADGDIKIQGIDGASTITALTLDMSAAGAATFNDLINIGGSSLNFTKVDGVGINAKESLSITIDSDNNDASRVFSVLDGNGTTLMQVTDAGEATFNQGAVFNEAGVDSDFRVEGNNRANLLVVDGGKDMIGIGMAPDQSWGSNSVGINFGIGDTDAGAITWQEVSGADPFNFSWNAYNDNTNWKYASNNPSSKYHQQNGRHVFNTAAAGSADANITFIENLSLSTGGAVFNEAGVDADFRVESDNNPNAFFVEGLGAGTNNLTIGMGTSTITNPYSQTNFTDLNIDGVWGGVISFKLGGTEKGWIGQRNSGNGGMALGSSSGNSLYLNSGGNTSRMEFTSAGNVVVNPTGADNDFTVSSDNNASMLTVDGGADLVTISGGSKVTNEKLRVNGAQVVGSGDAGVYTLGISNIFAASAAKYLRIQQDGSLFGGLTITATGDYSNVNAIGCFTKIYSIGANNSNTTLFGPGNVTVADLGETSNQFSMGTPTKPNGTTIYIPLENLNASYILAMSLTIEFRGRIAGISSIDIIDQ